MIRYIIGLMFLILFISCGTSKLNQSNDDFISQFKDRSGYNFRLQPNETMMKGNLVHKEIEFQYALDKEIGEFPESIEYIYRKAFIGHQYRKFFQELNVDSKLQKVFLDSVQILRVHLLGNNYTGIMLIPCESCNVYADIKFKGNVFKYPMQVSDVKLEKSMAYTFSQNLEDFPFVTFSFSGVKSYNNDHQGIYNIRESKDGIKKTLIFNKAETEQSKELSKKILNSMIHKI